MAKDNSEDSRVKDVVRQEIIKKVKGDMTDVS